MVALNVDIPAVIVGDRAGISSTLWGGNAENALSRVRTRKLVEATDRNILEWEMDEAEGGFKKE